MKRQSFIKGALIISLGGLTAKVLGALYRIPQVRFLGGEGMGIYQLAYPLYGILLTLSASGIPSGIARLVSLDTSGGAERRAFLLYGAAGLIGSAVMFALSAPLEAAQGADGVMLCCRILSPSVFFVSLISVVRGYFQGTGDMAPTAYSEILEQCVKVAAGICLSSLFAGNAVKAAAAAMCAVTLSEAVCCTFCIGLYLCSYRRTRPLFNRGYIAAKRIFSYTLPLTVSSLASPLSLLAESVAVVGILRAKGMDATALYGIYSGCAVTLINLPVSITYGLAAASVPQIAPLYASGDCERGAKTIKKALLYTAATGVPSAAVLYVFSPLAARIIFSSLSAQNRELLVKLVRIMSVNAVTASLVQTSSACISATGKPYFAVASQWAAATFRVGLSAYLTAFTSLSVAGAALSANICYFVALALNLWYIIAVIKRQNAVGRRNFNVGDFDRIGRKRRRFNAVG